MKKLQLLLLLSLFSLCVLNAQQTEPIPESSNFENTIPIDTNRTAAPFDLEFIYNVGAEGAIGSNSQAGVIFLNDQYWVSGWETNLISILDNEGNFVETFVIPNLSGTRGFTTDGTRLWAGRSSLQIFEIDPVDRVIINTIDITTTSSAIARMAAYDASLDGGNGGFWIGSFSSDIASVDMNGNELSVVPSATHGMDLYGGVVDIFTAGGPYLLVHHIPGETGDVARDQIVQLSLPDGVPTGVLYDFANDQPADADTVLAGGIAISPAGGASVNNVILGLSQSIPSDLIFGLELGEVLNTEEQTISSFALYPNPSLNGTVIINTQVDGDVKVSVYDTLGKELINATISKNELDVSALNTGVYIVQVSQNGVTAQKSLIVN